MEEQNRGFNFPHFLLYLGIALALAVPFGILFPVRASANEMLTRICNGLFFGGMLVGAWGGIGIASNLGAFALFAYSNKKVWQVLFHRNDLTDEKKLGSYSDYLAARKKRTEVFEMLLAGLIPMAVSLVISFLLF